jgi:hypothetical protein
LLLAAALLPIKQEANWQHPDERADAKKYRRDKAEFSVCSPHAEFQQNGKTEEPDHKAYAYQRC